MVLFNILISILIYVSISICKEMNLDEILCSINLFVMQLLFPLNIYDVDHLIFIIFILNVEKRHRYIRASQSVSLWHDKFDTRANSWDSTLLLTWFLVKCFQPSIELISHILGPVWNVHVVNIQNMLRPFWLGPLKYWQNINTIF